MLWLNLYTRARNVYVLYTMTLSLLTWTLSNRTAQSVGRSRAYPFDFANMTKLAIRVHFFTDPISEIKFPALSLQSDNDHGIHRQPN